MQGYIFPLGLFRLWRLANFPPSTRRCSEHTKSEKEQACADGEYGVSATIQHEINSQFSKAPGLQRALLARWNQCVDLVGISTS
jgi:hypothetical protein